MRDSDWNDSNLRSIAVQMNGVPARSSGAGDLLVVFNADDAPVEMTLPSPPPDGVWELLFDTTEEGTRLESARYGSGDLLRVGPQSTVLLESKTG
jgi:pullulanase/glycogen debranching enzyme